MAKCKQCKQYFEAESRLDYFCIKCHKDAKRKVGILPFVNEVFLGR